MSFNPHMFTMETSNNFHQLPWMFSAKFPGLVKAARHPWLFGASLTAMRNLCLQLGYTLVHLSDVDRGRPETGGDQWVGDGRSRIVGEILSLGLGDYGLNL